MTSETNRIKEYTNKRGHRNSTQDMQKIKELLTADEFPRSNSYDPMWVVDNAMGPNALWLTEWVSRDMDLKPGMKVLDLGCGRAMSSVFLAREYGVRVWANDLWIPASENWKLVKEAGMEDLVCPIHAEAHDLPYAEGFFDAAVSLDAYQYFGTDDLYLNYFRRFVKPGGQIGLVLPGLNREFEGAVPEHLLSFWVPDCWCIRTLDWWEAHLNRPGLVDLEVADTLKDGWKFWLKTVEAVTESGNDFFAGEIEPLTKDAGDYLSLLRIVCRTKEISYEG